MAYGQNGHIGISFQDSLGTSNVDSMDYFPMVSESLTESIEDLLSESLSSRYEEPDSYEGMHAVEGDVVFEVHPHLIGKLCKAWAGQSTPTIVNSAYSHLALPVTTDFIEGVAALIPMSIEVYKDTGSASLFFDCMLNTLAFEIAQGAFYKVTASIIGAQFAFIDKSTPSYDQSSFYTWDTASLSIAGTAVSDISQATITLNNNLAGKAFLDGKKYNSRILRDDFRTIEIAGTALLNGVSEVEAYKNRTQRRMVLTTTDPSTIMDNTHNSLEIDVPKMLYTDFPDNISGSGLIEVGFTAKGKYDTTSSYAVQLTAVNTTPAY